MTNVDMIFAAPRRANAQSAQTDCALPADAPRLTPGNPAGQQPTLNNRQDDQANHQPFSAQLRSRTQADEQEDVPASEEPDPTETDDMHGTPAGEADPLAEAPGRLLFSSALWGNFTSVMHPDAAQTSTHASPAQEQDLQTPLTKTPGAQLDADGNSNNPAIVLPATTHAAGVAAQTTVLGTAQTPLASQTPRSNPTPATQTMERSTLQDPIPENAPTPVAAAAKGTELSVLLDTTSPITLAATNPDQPEIQHPVAATAVAEGPDVRPELVASLSDQMTQEQSDKDQANNRSSQPTIARLASTKADMPETDASPLLPSQQTPMQAKAAPTAATPAESSPAAPEPKMDLSRFVEQFDRLALRTMRSNDQQIRIELEPAALGKLFLQCKEADGALQITIGVQGDTVRSLLMGQEADLRASLADQGVQVGQFSVSCQDREQRSSHPQTDETPTRFPAHSTETEADTNDTNKMPARHATPWGRNQWVA